MSIFLVLFIFLYILGRWPNYLTLYSAGVIMYVEVKERLQKKKQQTKGDKNETTNKTRRNECIN